MRTATARLTSPPEPLLARLLVLAANLWPVQDYQAYLRSDVWRRRALACKKRYGFRCALCNTIGPLNAHHRTYARLGFELSSDLIALCRYCHAKHHDKLP